MSTLIPRRTLATLIAGALALSSSMLPIAHAQSAAGSQPMNSADAGLDNEPPLLDHSTIASGIAGDAQVFLATVSDERALAEVTLFYRFKGEERFASLPMTPIDGSDNFTTSLPTSEGESRDIEYYIEAADESGNRVVQGFVFEPLIRQMEPPPEAVGASMDTPDVGNETEAAGMSTGKKIFYVVLGILVVGGIAAALNESDSDDGGSSSTGGGSGGGDDTGSDGGNEDSGTGDAGGSTDDTGGDSGDEQDADDASSDEGSSVPVSSPGSGDLGFTAGGSGLRLGITF